MLKRSNICGVFVCQDRFPIYSLSSLCSVLLQSKTPVKVMLQEADYDSVVFSNIGKHDSGLNSALRLCRSAGTWGLYWVYASGKLEFCGSI